MKKQDFNKSWTLMHGLSSIIESISGKQGKFEQVDLPHDGLISRPRYAQCPSGSGMAFFEGEDLQYSKTFFVGQDEKDQVHYLNFDGVYMNATVLVNNRFVANHAYGYTPFTLRIDEYLNYGADNQVTVTVRGQAMPNARWYPGLGIYREVTYLTAGLVHLVPDGLRLTTLDCDEILASVEIEAEVANADHHSHHGDIVFALLDDQGRIVSSERNRFYISANDKLTLRTRLEVEAPRLWDAENPNLYTCNVSLVENNRTLDCDSTQFGIRKLQFDSHRGLRVNGKTVKLRGGCIHHDNAMIGAVSVPDAEIRKIRLMKTGGYNAIRTAHNPPSKALLDTCDRLGMYVMDEFTDVWPESKAIYDYGTAFPSTWEQDVTDFVRRDYNHPSVILWSIGNEIPETGDLVSDKWGKLLVEKFKSLDRSRPVTNGINVMVAVMSKMGEVLEKITGRKSTGGINDLMFADPGNSDVGDLMNTFGNNPLVVEYSQEAADMLDIVGYNYTAELYARQHEIHPNRIFFGSETNPPVLDKNWEIVMNNPYVIGDFCWTGWDYLGEVGGGRLELLSEFNGKFMADYPYICAYQADFNLIGDRRPMSYWRDTIWTGRNHQPYISVHNPARYGMQFRANAYAWTDSLPTWSWTGQEGKLTAVEVYTDAEEVELIVNGNSLGRRVTGQDGHRCYVIFETVYAPGTITAISRIGGLEVGQTVLKTVDPHVQLHAECNKTTLRAGSNDLCYVTISLRDPDGTLDMLSSRAVTAQVEGAILAGMGSADPMTTESYQSDTHRFFEGKVLAIVKAGNTAGDGRITLKCEGCDDLILPLHIL